MSILGALPEGLVCRPLQGADFDGVVECLGRGFPERASRHWQDALVRLGQRPAVEDLPRYGYVLDNAGQIVGVMLTLFFRHAEGEAIRCNLSSWAVDEAFRAYAGKLIMTAMRRRDVTYLSITPAPVTLKVTEALRFKRFAEGQYAFAPLLGRAGGGRTIVVTPETPELATLTASERHILLEHAALGCDALICIRNGVTHPFVFKARRVLRGLVPCSQVIYCRSHADLALCAGAIGRHLLRKGHVFGLVDASAPVSGLVGRYFAGVGPKYAKGPNPPWPGDLAFTEFVVFGS
nr:hypothetical protein [uncultured Shinella sp.]